MVGPERRTKADILATAIITVVALISGIVVWYGSDARATESSPSPAPISKPPEPRTLDPHRTALTEAWRAPSPASEEPAVTGGTVTTGQGTTVQGRDPTTGAVRWSYERDLPLCAITAEWERAIAVYEKSNMCGEVSTINGGTGKRGPQRTGPVERDTRLLTDGNQVTATGNQVIETWRNDMVRTQQYGLPVAIKNPKNNMPRSGCTYRSVGVGNERVGIIEQCPGDPGDRVTVVKAVPEDSEKPEEVFSTVVGGHGATIVAVTRTHTAVLLPGPPRLAIYDSSGSLRGEYAVNADVQAGAPMRVAATSRGGAVYWHTGNDTIALNATDLTPLWTLRGTLGPGTTYGDQLLVPVPGGIAVHEPHTGFRQRVVAVDRGGYRGPVRLSSSGSTLLEQRADTIVALR